jgi:hypothetical protein
VHQVSSRARLGWMVVVLAGMLIPGRGMADEIKPLLPGEKAFGLTLTEWATAYFQWYYSLPASGHPATDKTGVHAGKAQRLPVWFLPQSDLYSNEILTRTVFVPDGCGILFSGALMFSASLDPGQFPDEEWFAEAQELADDSASRIKKLEVSLDGVPIQEPQQYRVRTPIFTVVIPPGNLMGWPVTPGEDHRVTAIGEAYFLLLPPLPVGKHVLRYQREGIRRSTEEPYTHTEVYNLIIQEPNKAIQ